MAPLTPIGDIGTATLTENTPENPITWETAADWDAAAVEAGVVHEAIGDNPAADVVTMGYPSYDEHGNASLRYYYPLNDDSGTTAVNEGGSYTTDGTYEGSTQPTLNQAGIHGRTSVEFAGVDDQRVDIGDADIGAMSYSVCAWFKTSGAWGDGSGNAQDDGHILNGSYNNSDAIPVALNMDDGTGKVQGFGFYDGSWQTTDVNGAYDDQAWHSVVGSYDASTGDAVLYVDGVVDATATLATSRNVHDLNKHIAWYDNDNATFYGNIQDVRVFDYPLTDAEAQAYHDAGTGGSLETADKSFSSSATPDLTSLTYSLNAGTLEIEAIGSPASASEEVVSSGPLDGTQTSATLSWSSSHTDFRVRPIFSTTNPTDTPPTVSSISLQP